MLGGVTLAAMLCIWSLGGVLAIIVGSVHVWSMAGAGAGVASVLAALGIRLHRKRRGPWSLRSAEEQQASSVFL
jgi:hypothetical protein